MILSQIVNLISTPTKNTIVTALVIPQPQQQKRYNFLLKRIRTKALVSPLTWFILFVVCLYAIYKKVFI
jgi:hypothetical protein